MLLLAGPETCGSQDEACLPCKMCVRDISIDIAAACVLMHNGSIACAGDNYYGQLGTGKPSCSELVFAADPSHCSGWYQCQQCGVELQHYVCAGICVSWQQGVLPWRWF